MFNIDNHEKEIWAVGYEDKTNQTKDKWNQLNIMDIQSMLGNSYCLPLLHMAKSCIWLEETNQRINEFSIGYMINPNLSMKNISESKLKCVWELHFLHQPWHISVKYYWNQIQ